MRAGRLSTIVISVMLPFAFIQRTWGESVLRYLSVLAAVLAVLAVLITGVLASETSADATSYDSEELQFLQLLNQYRENNGVGPLILSDTLAVAAGRHSQDMARYDFFAHDTAASSYYPAGSAPWDRMAAEGYDYNTLRGENIAVGCESAETCFEMWRNSPSHNAAMLDDRYRVIGIARVNMPGSAYGWYWTTDFGATLDPTSHPPGETSQAGKTNERPEKPVEDGLSIENGGMNGKAVWEQKAKDGADLILDGYARLGDYNNGEDDLRQKIRVTENTELSYAIKIRTAERHHPYDRLLVRLMDKNGEQLGVLKRYTDGDAGGWRRDTVDLSRFAGRTVYLSFFVETDPMLRTAFYLDRVTLENKGRS
jgi:uncharacterized protein YkwD